MCGCSGIEKGMAFFSELQQLKECNKKLFRQPAAKCKCKFYEQ